MLQVFIAWRYISGHSLDHVATVAAKSAATKNSGRLHFGIKKARRKKRAFSMGNAPTYPPHFFELFLGY